MSIFTLAKEPTPQLSGISDAYYEKVSPTQALDPSFGNAMMSYRWEPSGTDWFVPARSYIRLRFNIKNSAGDSAPLFDAATGSRMSTEYMYVAKGDAKHGNVNEAFTSLNGGTYETAARMEEKNTAEATGIRPAWNMAANFFSQAKFYIGTNQVSQCTEYLPQVDAYKKRTSQSVGMRNGLAAATLAGASSLPSATTRPDQYGFSHTDNTWDIPGMGRVYDLTGQFDSASAVTECELIWVPPLGIFDYQGALPGSQFRLELMANQRYETECWDTSACYFKDGTGAMKDARTLLSEYKIEVKSVDFYVAMVSGPRADDEKYALDIQDIRCIADGLGGSTTTKGWDVPASTRSVGFAAQNGNVDLIGGPSVFRTTINPEVPLLPRTGRPRAPVSRDNITVGLKNWFISYDGKQYPPEHSDQKYGPNSTGDSLSYMVKHRWMDSVTQCGTAFSSGGCETLQEWLTLGPTYFVSWPRQGTANATRLLLTTTVDSEKAKDQGPHNWLIFVKYSQAYLIRTSDSRVVQVETPFGLRQTMFTTNPAGREVDHPLRPGDEARGKRRKMNSTSSYF